MAKNVYLAVVLSIILYGVGQIYLDRVNRGVIILGVGLTLSIGFAYLFGFAIGVTAGVAFWIWQVIDAYRIAKKSHQPQPAAESRNNVSQG